MAIDEVIDMSRSLRRFSLPWFALLSSLATAPIVASAQTENYETVLIGESAAGMGGAFTAVADDASATIHNPAGLGQIERSGLSLSANTYTYHSTTYEGVISGFGESEDLRVDGVMVLPNTAAYVLPLYESGDVQHTGAISLIVPYAFDWEGHQQLSIPDASLDLDIFRSIDQRTYMAGPSYGVRIGKLHLGASLFGHYLYSQNQERAVVTLNAEGGTYRSHEFQYTTLHHFSLTAILGALYRFTERFSLGLRVRLPNIHIAGWAHTYRDAGASLVAPNEMGMPVTVALYQDVYPDVEGDIRVRYPTQISLGAAYAQPKVFRIAADVRLYLPQDSYELLSAPAQPPPMQPNELPGFEDQRGFDPTVRAAEAALTMNIALGAEVFVGGDFSVLGGLFTDLSSVPDDDPNGERFDMVGASLAVSRKTNDSSLTIGCVGRYGTGHAEGLVIEADATETGEIDVHQWSITVLIGASTTFGS